MVGALILGLLGLADSAYLSWIKLAGKTAVCAGIGDCETVNTSIYSQVGGLPVAVLGAVGYLSIVMVVVAILRRGWAGDDLGLVLFGLTTVGVLYSAYLTYIELAVLHAICPYCAASALIMLGLWIISLLLLRQSSSQAL